jgi:hypothetical protein
MSFEMLQKPEKVNVDDVLEIFILYESFEIYDIKYWTLKNN